MRLNVKSFDYEESGNKLEIQSWMTLAWFDNRLIWNPSDFAGITSIHMKSDMLWSPNLKVYNTHITSESSCEIIDCIISNSSRVACVMPCTHTAHCKDTGVVNWPYDTQNCEFTFGSWMKSGEQLNYNEKKVVLVVNRAKQNGEWNLVNSSSVYNKGIYSSLNETFPTVRFTFTIERHNGFHEATSIITGVVLILTNLMMLCLSPGSFVRVVLGGAILFCNTIALSFLFYM
jgi:Neurotransmitter-gated ion-channel ligand binding domain